MNRRRFLATLAALPAVLAAPRLAQAPRFKIKIISPNTTTFAQDIQLAARLGGPPIAGTPYLIGERGPEIVYPSSANPAEKTT